MARIAPQWPRARGAQDSAIGAVTMQSAPSTSGCGCLRVIPVAICGWSRQPLSTIAKDGLTDAFARHRDLSGLNHRHVRCEVSRRSARCAAVHCRRGDCPRHFHCPAAGEDRTVRSLVRRRCSGQGESHHRGHPVLIHERATASRDPRCLSCISGIWRDVARRAIAKYQGCHCIDATSNKPKRSHQRRSATANKVGGIGLSRKGLSNVHCFTGRNAHRQRNLICISSGGTGIHVRIFLGPRSTPVRAGRLF